MKTHVKHRSMVGKYQTPWPQPMRPSSGQKCRRCGRPIEENRVRLRIDVGYVGRWLGNRHPVARSEKFRGQLQDASGTNSWWGWRPEYCNDCTLALNIRREPRHQHQQHPRRDRRAPGRHTGRRR